MAWKTASDRRRSKPELMMKLHSSCNHKLKTSKVPLERPAQVTSLFTSQRGFQRVVKGGQSPVSGVQIKRGHERKVLDVQRMPMCCVPIHDYCDDVDGTKSP